MDDKAQYEGLLIKFLAGETNETENILIENWLYADQHNMQFFEEIRHVWQMIESRSSLNRIDIDNEWSKCRKDLLGVQGKVVPIQRELLGETFTEVSNTPSRGIYKSILQFVVAASVLLVFWFGWQRFSENNIIDKGLVVNSVAKDSLLAFVRHEKNISGKDQQLLLNEGSTIILSDQSEVFYNEPFINNRRDIHLKGMANFIVAKDQIRPFTVFSGGLSTTALGTEFSVNAFENNKNIVIRLYEGKIVVRSADSVRIKLRKDIYLLPGQELLYNQKTGIAKVRSFLSRTTGKSKSLKNVYPDENPSVPKNQKGSWYMFNNQPLSDVFEQLMDMYQIEIIYSKKDVRKMYFIGKFGKSDSVENILKQIALLNNLKVSKDANRFIISK
jgi:transmembrane sensor